MSERKPETYAVIGAMDAAINDLTSAKSTAVETIARLVDRIKELESRIELAQWLAADPCTPGFVGEALRGRKLDEMPETVQAMIKEDMEQSNEA